MNEFVVFLKTDLNWIWGVAAIATGSLWLSSFIPTKNRRKTVPAQKAVLMMNNDSAVMVDIRDKNDYVKGHIPGSRNAPLAHLAETLKQLKLSKETPIVLTCASGQRASQAFKTLIESDYTHAYILEQGIQGWQSAGLPVVKKG